MENFEMNLLIFTLRIIVLITTIVGIIHILKLIKHIYFGYGVPFVPTPDYKIEKLPEIIKLTKGQKFLDIGCGDGKVLEIMKKAYNDGEILGIENSTDIYKLALKRKQKNGFNYNIIKGDFFKEDFSTYDIIYTFMIPYLMPKIWKKIKNECKSGTLFYSNAYEIRGEIEYQKVEVKKNNFIYIYKV